MATSDSRFAASSRKAGRLLGVVFEAVVPVGAVEPDLEHGIAGERQPVAAVVGFCNWR